MAKLNIFSLHLKYCDILFDDLKTREIVKCIMVTNKQKCELNDCTSFHIDSENIVSNTRIHRFATYRCLCKLEGHYQLVHRISAYPKIFLTSTYFNCLTQLEKLKGDCHQEFIRLFKENGADFALEYANLLQDPIIKMTFNDIYQTSTISNGIVQKKYNHFSKSVCRFINEKDFDKMFMDLFSKRTKKEYYQFKNAAYNGTLGNYYGIDKFWDSTLMHFLLTLSDLMLRAIENYKKV